MTDFIKIPTTLGHKISVSTNVSVLKGMEHTSTYKKFAVSLEVPASRFRDSVEAKCEICDRTLKLKVLMPRYYRLWRNIWLGVLAVVLGSVLYFKHPYSTFTMIFMGILGVIILRLLFWRNPKPVVTWQDNANRDQQHIVL
jgi:hypothetical protein